MPWPKWLATGVWTCRGRAGWHCFILRSQRAVLLLGQGGTVNDCGPLIVVGREKLVLGGTGGGFEPPVGFPFFGDIPQIGRVVSGRDCPQANLD